MGKGVRVVASLLVVLVGLAPLTTQASEKVVRPAEEPNWASLPYFRHDYGGWFRIWTNENTFDNGVRVINADRGSVFTPYPGPTTEELQVSTEYQALWSERCKRVDEQTFTTTRKIYLPGNADKLQVALGAYSYHSQNKPSPVNSVELLVNGIGVHKVKSSAGNPIPFMTDDREVVDVTDEAHLVFGLNTFKLIAHKKPTKKSAGWCTGDNKFGALGEVYGEFLADLSVTRTLGTEVPSGFFFDVTVRNLGPSVLIPNIVGGVGEFGAKASGAGVTFKNLYITPTGGCREQVPIDEYPGPGLARGCTLPQMEPGASLTFTVLGEYQTPITPTTQHHVRGSTGGIGYGETTPEETANNNTPFTYQYPSPSP